VEKNEIIIGSEIELGKDRFSIQSVNWINGEIPTSPFNCEVKIRYKSRFYNASCKIDQDNV
jgi:tRNA U34 2-thiouridine synthase MnmA/TrmU